MAYPLKKTVIKQVIKYTDECLGIYCRVSTDKQLTNTSIANQKERGISKAKQLGIAHKIYCDEGLSGSLSVAERPMLNEMMQDIFAGKLSHVWAIDLDRISRDKVEGAVIMKDLLHYSITFILNDEIIDQNNDASVLMTSIRLIFAAYELSKIRTRVIRGLHKRVADGGAHHIMLPYGFKKVNKQLLIDDVEADVVRNIFQLALQNQSCYSIAHTLNDNGIPTKREIAKLNGDSHKMTIKRGGKKVVKTSFTWAEKTVHTILRNKLYMGERMYGGKIYSVTPIVDQNIFDAVQIQLSIKQASSSGKNDKYFYLLKGLIQCKVCGRNFYGRKRETLVDNHYTCLSTRYKKDKCGNSAMLIPTLDKYVLDSIQQLPDAARKQIEILSKNQEHTTINSRVDKLESEIQLLVDKQDKILDLLVDEVITKKDYTKQKTKIESDIATLQAMLDLTKPDASIATQGEALITYLDNVSQMLLNASITDKDRQTLVRSIISHITVYNGDGDMKKRINIEYRVNEFRNIILQSNITFEQTINGSVKIINQKISPVIDGFVITQAGDNISIKGRSNLDNMESQLRQIDEMKKDR